MSPARDSARRIAAVVAGLGALLVASAQPPPETPAAPPAQTPPGAAPPAVQGDSLPMDSTAATAEDTILYAAERLDFEVDEEMLQLHRST